ARYPESLPCRPPRTPGIHQITTTNSGGSTLRYTLSIPDTYDPEKPQPFLFRPSVRPPPGSKTSGIKTPLAMPYLDLVFDQPIHALLNQRFQ
ncbi:MAG: hypothetical protein KJ874_13395, partial [Acidobacteria bacterium]|nr:hypothetical protein [Acidobacteriota bacterium]